MPSIHASYGVYVGLTPLGLNNVADPRTIKAPVTVAGNAATLDLTQAAQHGKLRFAQSVYLDLADIATTVVVTLTHRATGFRVRVKGGTQGWFPLAITEAMQFDIATTGLADGTVLPLWFANFAAPNFQWASV